MPFAIAMGLVVVVLAFAWGYLGDTQRFVTLSTQPDDGECSAACHALEIKRAELCGVKFDIDERQQLLGPLTAQLGLAQLVALGLLAATVAASAIPIFGSAIASGLATAYATAQAYAIYLLGRHVAATEGVRALMAQVPKLTAEDQEAQKLVREKCPADRASGCIAGLMNC